MKFLLIIYWIVFSIDAGGWCEAYISKYEQMLQIFPMPAYLQLSTPIGRSMDRTNKNTEQHPCKRQCRSNESIICYYYFVAHHDETFNHESCKRYLDKHYRFKVNGGGREYIDSFALHNNDNGYDDCKYGDGVRVAAMVINGQMPGPTIEVCRGDIIVVDVINSMMNVTSIHWHGLHQRKTPHMDGVPYITQYPIEPGQAFRYRFEADNAGTHWWHSHVGHQRAVGLAGALVVRVSRGEDKHSALYDFDYSNHTIMLYDWMYAADDVDALARQSILLNGLGRHAMLMGNDGGKKFNKSDMPPILYAWFNVIRGGRYRFRVIYNGIGNCPVSLSIDKHDLVVIASDGSDIEPVAVRKITLHGGERFDFVLHANQAVENYWMRIKGYNFCEPNKVHQEAILHYQGANQRGIPKGTVYYGYEPSGKELNTVDKPPKDDRNLITIADLKALEGRLSVAGTPYRTYYTNMHVNPERQFFQIDYITFKLPSPISLLQSRNLGIEQHLCNKTQLTAQGLDCRESLCECTNVIEVPLFKHVEFVISSTSNTAHPVHLHGYTFRVVGSGVLGEKRIYDIEEIDRRTPLPRRVFDAPLKDTVQVPAWGYTILRFYTDSPGYWILHCHISTHSERGMAAVLRVGTPMEMKTCPVSNCGLCSSVL